MAENEKREISEKQKRFVREWLIDMNGTRAAIRAGYSEKSAAQTANRLMKMPEVRQYRDALLQEEFEALGVTRHSLATELWRLYQRCTQATPVKVWDSAAHEYIDGGEWQFDSKGAAKVAGMLLGLLDKLDGGKEEAGEGGYEAALLGGEREF